MPVVSISIMANGNGSMVVSRENGIQMLVLIISLRLNEIIKISGKDSKFISACLPNEYFPTFPLHLEPALAINLS